jgi:hypothetical protein
VNMDHLDYHIVATTYDAGGVRLRKGWPVAIFLKNMLQWQAEFYKRINREQKVYTRDILRTKEFEYFVQSTARPHIMW